MKQRGWTDHAEAVAQKASGCTSTCGCDGCMGHWERPRMDRRRFEDGRAVSRGPCERDAAAGVRQRRRTPENGAGTICRRALPVTVFETELRPALPPTPFTALARTVFLEYNYARRLGGRPSPPALRPSSPPSSFSAPLRFSRPCLHTPQASRSTASSSTQPRPVPHHPFRTTNGVTLRTPWRPTTNEMR